MSVIFVIFRVIFLAIVDHSEAKEIAEDFFVDAAERFAERYGVR